MDDDIKLGRVGHYSYQDVCQSAEIVKVHPKQFDSEAGGELPRLVNLHGHSHEGDCFTRRGVPVGVSESPEAEFHFNRDCPKGA